MGRRVLTYREGAERAGAGAGRPRELPNGAHHYVTSVSYWYKGMATPVNLKQDAVKYHLPSHDH